MIRPMPHTAPRVERVEHDPTPVPGRRTSEREPEAAAGSSGEGSSIHPLVFIPVIGWLFLALMALFEGGEGPTQTAESTRRDPEDPELPEPMRVGVTRRGMRTEPLAAMNEPRRVRWPRQRGSGAVRVDVPFRAQRNTRDCDNAIRWMANSTFGRPDDSYWLYGGHASDLRMATGEPRSGQIDGRSSHLDLARRRIGFQEGRQVVDALLDRGMPVYVGVARRGGTNLNADGITDHWVLITERTADGRYLYHDPARGPGFAFRVAESGMLFNTDPRTVGSAGYQVSVVRPPWRVPPSLATAFDDLPANSAPGQVLRAIQTAGAILNPSVA